MPQVEEESGALRAAVATALAGPGQRIVPLTLADGRRVWLKRIERRGLMERLQKGDPKRSFAAERAGLRALAAAGIAVPDILAEDRGFMVLADAGPSLDRLAGDTARGVESRLTGFAAGGRALGRLHAAGFAHGRPAVRDICWDGAVACFIDLENFRQGPASRFRQARDLFLLCHSAERQWPDAPQWIDTMLAAYTAAAPPEMPLRASRFAHRLRWLGWAARGGLAVQPQSRTLRAVGPALARLRKMGRVTAPC